MVFASRQRSVERTSIPVDDLEKALSQYCTPPMPDKLTGQRANISDGTFKHVTDLLEHLESHQSCQGWSVRPRIYTVLRNVGRLDLFQKFIDLGLKDISFPYTVEKLPSFLQEDSLRDSFLRNQKYVLTDASQLEKGRHAYTKNADDLFRVVKHLGRGGYGSVDQVWSLMSFAWFARKQFLRKKSPREDQAMLKNFENELSNLKRLSHQHLVKLVGSYTDQKSVAFLMVPIADMNLLTFLESYKRGQDDTSLRRYFGCLANALGYLHGQRIRHRDLKPENILIKDLKVYIADFGTALDWSHKLKDTTTDVGVPATARYMAPEVANRMPRKSASDMWSLGVIYLEMVTVLRGQSLSALRKFLEKNGTRHPFVFGNPPATTQWFEKLRLEGIGPESDNEPLTWIKDLTQPDPLRRPQPWALTEQIKNSSSTSFTGICCANDETVPDYPSPPSTAYSGENAKATTQQEQLAAFEPIPRSFGSVISQSSQHSVEQWLGTAGGSVEGAFLDGQYFEDPYEIVEDTTMETTACPDSVLRDLEEDSTPATSTGYEITEEDSDDGNEGVGQIGYEITEDSSGSERTIRPSSPSRLVGPRVSTEPAASSVQSVKESHFYGEDPSHDFKLQKAITEHLESIRELPEPPLTITTAAVNVKDHSTVRWVDHRSAAAELRAPSGESTRTSIPNHRDTQPPARVPSATNTPLGGNSAIGLRNQQPLTEQSLTPEVARGKKRTTGPGASTATTGFILPNMGLTSENLARAPTATSGFALPNKGLTSENLAQLDADSSNTASITLRGRDTQRSKLTADPLMEMMAAEDYMQEVWEAASTRVTSVVTARTRKALSSLGPGVVWQDRHLRYVEHYAKQGMAAAVRELLQAGCNPGTTRKPNYRPLINAVRAGTPRHNKVVRVLLDNGADVNAVHPATGKTSLHFAIENPYFPGYTNLIRNLLEHAANPNALDRNEDTPLLQILYGGYGPLEKHKRDALACLLQPHLDTDVNVMPPGTLNMPIHLAVRRRDALAVGMLIQKGSRVNDPNGAGTTPLRMAASSCKGEIWDNEFELLRYLLKSGADVNEKSGEDGDTALHLAAIQGCMQAVRLLLSHNADPSVQDKQGRTPLQAATANKSKMSGHTFAVIKERLKEYA
ncbi:MAG: hypothetical protein LQ348_006052 [Seirophora lacunosa]|nr:MAG: hypothetical protein LQ348_006052 [Seirophora lacunosa]